VRKFIALLAIFGVPLLAYGAYYWNWYSQDKTLEISGTIRKYRLHVPLNFKKQGSLVVMLHGYADSPRLMEIYSNMSRLADEKGFVVAYPYGSNGEVDKSLSWNAGFCCGTALFNMSDDIGFINLMTNKIVKEYDIDAKKVYLAGFSNGALLTLKIASERPELFSAYGVMAGAIGGQGPGSNGFVNLKMPKIPTKIIMIHGKDDPAIPYEGGQSKYLGRIPSPVSVVSFAISKKFWLTADKCEGLEANINNGVTREIGKKCAQGSNLEAISVEGRGHIWLGGMLEQVTYGETKKVNTSEEFWRFFNES